MIDEINALGIKGLAVADLNLLTGSFVNLPYPLANGYTVRFLKDNDIYFGNQVEQPDSDRCYGIVANEEWNISARTDRLRGQRTTDDEPERIIQVY